jgi:hypothetical protein
VRATDASSGTPNDDALVPAAGALTGASTSTTVPKIDSVPSRLSITSINRDCRGQSMCEGLSIPQKPPPPERGNAVTRFSWV